jgi:hypothetical protein
MEGEKHGKLISRTNGSTESAPTPGEIFHVTVAGISLGSDSSFQAGRRRAQQQPSHQLRLRWRGVASALLQPGTAEIVLYAMNRQLVEGRLFVDSAVVAQATATSTCSLLRAPSNRVSPPNGIEARELRGEVLAASEQVRPLPASTRTAELHPDFF